MKRCGRCDAAVAPGASFCSRCGEPLAASLVRSTTRLSALLLQWRELSLQFTRKELRKLLGEPKRIDNTDGAIETWTYEYESVAGPGPRVAGIVQISTEESRVVGWREPDWERLADEKREADAM